MTWIMAFSLTQVIEVTVGLLFWTDTKVSMLRKISILFGASLITHPMVWFIFPQIRDEGGFSYGEYLLMVESYAYGVEALYYYAFRIHRPILLSVITNSCSFLTGVFLYEFVL